MARIRTIKPEFASDEKLAKVSRDARLTFVLLVTQADDDGLVPGQIRQLLGCLYPHDQDVTPPLLRGWLGELERIGAARWRSTLDDAPVVEICNWSKHQRIDHKAKPLLLKQLRPLPEEAREDVAKDSREPRAPTLDLGPTTEDQGPAARAGARREIARVANDAIDAAFGTTDLTRRPLLPSSAAAVIETLEQGAIPLDFALAVVRDAVPALKTPPRSLAYFAPIIAERWDEQQLRGNGSAKKAVARRGRTADTHAAISRGVAMLKAKEVVNG